jgi:hypothetical protein
LANPGASSDNGHCGNESKVLWPSVPTQTKSSTVTGSLRIELLIRRNLSLTLPVRANEVSDQLKLAGYVAGATQSLLPRGETEAVRKRPSRRRRARRGVAELEPPLRSVHFGSPLVITQDLDTAILESATALSLLIFSLRYLWGLDLIIKADRENLKAEVAEAKERALLAEERLAELEKEQQLLSDTSHPPTLEEENWGLYGERIRHQRRDAESWRGKDATWFIDD